MKTILLAAVLVVASAVMLGYAAAISVQSVNQLGGTGSVNVPKTDVRVLRVQVPPTTINTVSLLVSATLTGTYTVSVRVTVGACTATGSTTLTLSPTPTSFNVAVSPSCTFNNPATVTVVVTPQ